MVDRKDENLINIKDIIDLVSSSKNSEIFGSAHSSEAADIKRAWFNHMFTALENLKRRVDDINSEMLKDRTTFLRELVDAKENIRKELYKLKADYERGFKEVDLRLDDLSESSKMDLAEYKQDRLAKDGDTNKELNSIVTPMKEKISAIETRVGLFGLLAGAVGSSLMEFIFWLVKTYILSKGGTP